jgi:hypothetical protein
MPQEALIDRGAEGPRICSLNCRTYRQTLPMRCRVPRKPRPQTSAGFLFDGSALSENEIGCSPTSRGRSSPQQIHEEAVRQHNDKMPNAMRAVQMNAAAPSAHAAGSPIFMSAQPRCYLPAT